MIKPETSLLHQLSIIKKLDLRGNEARMTLGVFIWKLWGVVTSVRVVCISHKMMQSSILIGETMTHVQDSGLYLRPKVMVAVSNGFTNSPITKLGVNSRSIYPFLVVKNIEVLFKNRASFFNFKSRGINMIKPETSLLHQLSIIKKLDLRGNEARMTLGVFIWKLWGVETFRLSGKYQPYKWFYPRCYGRGDNRHVQGLSFCLCLKSIIAVLGGFSNSPITKLGVNSRSIYPFLVVKNIEVLFKNRASFFNFKSREINMVNPNKSQLQEQLIDAARDANIIAMKRLIKQGADPFEINWSGQSAITVLVDKKLDGVADIINELVKISKGSKL